MSAEAWILPLADGARAAVGAAELVHLFDGELRLFRIPLASAPCASLLLWDGRPVPLAAIETTKLAGAGRTLVAILAFDAEGAGEVEHGAIRIGTAPRRIVVDDADAAPPSEVPEHLLPYAHAAFRVGTETVPVLDLHALFGARAS